ncbi:MAG: hypothetical protein ACI9XO_001966 [Paraglaciecola sp.]|jgi:hypothetical protein
MKMKYLFTAVCILFMSISAQAQLKIGLKGGANYSQIKETGDVDFIDWEALTSYYVGGFAEIEMNDRLSLRAEGLYSFEGAEFDDGVNKRKVEISYFNLPLLLRLNIIGGVFIDAGVEPGIIVDGDNFYVDKDTEFGALLGGGFKLGQRLVFNLRYIWGLSNIYEFKETDVNGQTISAVQRKSTLWQIGAEFYIFK